MKNRYLREFLHRGLLFSGFGPVVVGIVYWIVGLTTGDTAIATANQFVAILSSYCLAFLVAGASVFYQIEAWGLAKATLFHMAIVYAAYLTCYLLNNWIAADWRTVGIFSGIFLVGYLAIWGGILISVKATAKKLNTKLNKT